ncbi:MAG: diaminopimelate epimerase [Eubacteriales bacterium]|nr:diaminopimelate epimerase [Eubacteriales bacterium]
MKMHGLGNDFIVALDAPEDDGALAALAQKACDRRTGVGADGLMLVRPSQTADVRMQLYNSDGSEAPMCGNGIRCFAKHVYEAGIVPKAAMRIETPAGVRDAQCTVENGIVTQVRICMGAPRFLSDGICSTAIDGEQVFYWPLDTGVPHAVVPVEDPTDRAHMKTGAGLERAKPFPKGTNVDFIKVLDRSAILMRVWERGCGETLCCGTGATAAAACACREGLVDDTVRVLLTLGELTIQNENGVYYMTGPAEYVFEGEIEL